MFKIKAGYKNSDKSEKHEGMWNRWKFKVSISKSTKEIINILILILSCSLDLFFINFYNIDFKLLRNFKLSSYYFYQLHLNRFLGSIHLMLFSLNKSFIFSLIHFLFTIFLVKEFGKYHMPNLSIQIYQISL